MIYPEKISERLDRRPQDKTVTEVLPVKVANFCCGSFVGFSLKINQESPAIARVSFASNGCGFMIAAADILAEYVKGKTLPELQGLADIDLKEQIIEKLGEFPVSRLECLAVSIEALHVAFAEHRNKQLDEFQGEKALICTCFGVSEDRIVSEIDEKSLTTVNEVGEATNAGTGCGSCRLLIQELLDNQDVDT